jgi:hypothetical protein
VGKLKRQTRFGGDRLSGAALAFVLFAVTLAAYAFLVSQQRNFDGPLHDAMRVARGEVDPTPRHPLYTYVGLPFYRLWRAIGYSGDAAYPLQVLNAFCGALGVCGLLVFLKGSFGRTGLAGLVATGYAFSYGYWYFTEDAFHNVSALVPVVWSLPMLRAVSRARGAGRRALLAGGLGFLSTLAVLGSQEHLLFALAMLTALALSDRRWHERIGAVASYLGVLGGCLLLAYAVMAVRVARCGDASCVYGWLRPYGGALLPMYGTLSLDRIRPAVWSFFAAIVPLTRGAGIPQPADGAVAPARFLIELALASAAVSLSLGAFWFWLRRKRVWREHREVVVLSVTWLVMHVPANVWLEPANPEHWIAPLVAVLVLVAAGCDAWLSWTGAGTARGMGLLGGGVVLLIFVANLTQAIWPDHARPNPDILMAQCAASHMGDADLLVSPVWDWTLYMPAEGKRGLSLPEFSLTRVGRNPDSWRLLAELNQVIGATETDGGRALLVDMLAYGPAEWAWIEANLGLQPDDVRRYQLELAFVCRGEKVWHIAGRERW